MTPELSFLCLAKSETDHMNTATKSELRFLNIPAKMSRMILAGLLFLAVCESALSLRAEVVNIPDPGLQSIIREALGRPTGDITKEDMLGLTNLTAFDRIIGSLEGLGNAVNLTTLDLGNMTSIPE